MTTDSMENFLVGGVRPLAGLAYTQIKGGREVNEDAYLLESREMASGSRISLMGVFDGHGNEQLSHWLSNHFADVFFRIFTIFQQSYGLPNCFDFIRKLFPSDESFRIRSKRLAALNCPEMVSLSLCATFAVCEEQAMTLSNVDTAHGGACATLVAVTYAGFFAAQIGDCSLSLLSKSPSVSTLFRTADHRPADRPDEISRIVGLGGAIYKGRAVGMAFSSLAVTRSVGDSLWRANDDWKRDKTRDGEGQLAMDEALSDFSRTKGCVGITSEPEWYSCCLQGGSSGGEQVVHWAVSTNAPSEVLSMVPKIFQPTEDLRFYLVVGSDGFWESAAVATISHRIDDNGRSPPSANELIEAAAAVIGTTPHDDTTVVVAELLVDPDGLVAAGSTISEKTSIKYRTARRSQSDQEDRHPPPRKGDLDYLFAKVY